MSDSPIKYRLIKKEKHTGARLGEIITPHGTFPTPMFMPVGTQATVQGLSYPIPITCGFALGTNSLPVLEVFTSS